jgi:hypothetical protein
MKLLREWSTFNFDKDLLKESIEKDGRLLLKGILQRADAVNQNNRIYPRDILAREIEDYQTKIKEETAWGELDHTDSPIVEYKNASHIVREARMEGNDVYGTVEIVDTPNGNIVRGLLKAGKIGISSRSVGSVRKQQGHDLVQDDLHLICWDIVSEPSTVGAFISEGRELTVEECNKIFTKTERIDRILKEILTMRTKR